MLKFDILANGEVVDSKSINELPVKIGKLSTSTLCIEGENVARIHAMIDHTGGRYNLVDLGSASGTFLNGKKVTKHALKTGDKIKLGDVELRLTIVEKKKRVVAKGTPKFKKGAAAGGEKGGFNPFAKRVVRVSKKKKDHFERRFFLQGIVQVSLWQNLP